MDGRENDSFDMHVATAASHEVYVPDEFAQTIPLVFGGNGGDGNVSSTVLTVEVIGTGGEVFVFAGGNSAVPIAVEPLFDGEVTSITIPVELVLDEDGNPLAVLPALSCTQECVVIVQSVSDGNSYGYRVPTANETATEFVIPSSPSVEVTNADGTPEVVGSTVTIIAPLEGDGTPVGVLILAPVDVKLSNGTVLPAGVEHHVEVLPGTLFTLEPVGGAGSDLSGTIIESDSPVFVYEGSECVSEEALKEDCSTRFAPLAPETAFGTGFVAAPFGGRYSGYVLRIMSSEDENGGDT